MEKTDKKIIYILSILLPFALVGPSFGGLISIRSIGAIIILFQLQKYLYLGLSKFEKIFLIFLLIELIFYSLQSELKFDAVIGKILISTWYILFILVRFTFKSVKDINVYTKIMVFQCIIVSILSLQEIITGVNYFSLIKPDTIDTNSVIRVGLMRYQGVFGHAGPTSIFVASLAPFIFFTKRLKIYQLVFLSLVIILIFYTQYRTIILSIIISFLLLLLFIPHTKNKIRIISIGLILVPLTLFSAKFLGFEISTLYHYVYRSMQSDYQDPHSLGLYPRIEHWLYALRFLENTPIFGYGISSVNQVLLNKVHVINEQPYPIFIAYKDGILMSLFSTSIIIYLLK